jgi:hypothetical protein
MQEKLAKIQKEVELKTSELNEFRKQNKFTGVSKHIFKPFQRNKDDPYVKEDDKKLIMQLSSSNRPFSGPK